MGNKKSNAHSRSNDMRNDIYLVGWIDKRQEIFHEIFATHDPDKVLKWCEKFSRILKSYKTYLEKYVEEDTGRNYLKEEHFDEWYIRWSDIQNIKKADFRIIEVR